MITPAQSAEVRRLFFAEHWTIGTIATQLGLHHDTVCGVLEAHRFTHVQRRLCPSQLDPYRAFIEQTLAQYPRLRATRVFEMVRARGYAGSVKTVRRLVRTLRPRPREVFFRTTTLPAEQGQVDWASFGHVTIGAARRPLSCFVLVLSWSRAMYAHFFLDQTLASFLRGHVLAFEHLGGAPRELLYDNLKTAVLERHGEHIRFHPQLLDLAGHYHFAPRPCAPRRGNEKGRVERAIQYLRHGFFAARSFRDVADLNGQLHRWIDDVAHARIAPEDEARRTVQTLWELERPQLLPLPAHALETAHQHLTRAIKTPYVRLDDNDYSIPVEAVGKPLTVWADERTVRVLDGPDEIARHARHYGRKQRLTQADHVAALVAHKRAARALSTREVLTTACPSATAFLRALAADNRPLDVRRLRHLLDQYGPADLEAALAAAVARGTLALPTLVHWLEQALRARGTPPPVPVVLPDDVRVRDLRVVPHDLESYDTLSRGDHDDE